MIDLEIRSLVEPVLQERGFSLDTISVEDLADILVEYIEKEESRNALLRKEGEMLDQERLWRQG